MKILQRAIKELSKVNRYKLYKDYARILNYNHLNYAGGGIKPSLKDLEPFDIFLLESLDNIKQADWNQNDENASDFIKNRICSEETIVVAKGTFNENSSIDIYSNDFIIPIVGNTYKITVKATGDYVCHTVQPAGSDGNLYIGYNIPDGNAYGGGTLTYNPNGVSGAPNGEKFRLMMSGNPAKLIPGTDLEITLETVNKIPEKFIQASTDLGGVQFKIDGTDLQASLDGGSTWKTVTLT